MKTAKLGVDKYAFTLVFSEDMTGIISSVFTFDGKEAKDISEEQLKEGNRIAEEIFNGKYDKSLLSLGLKRNNPDK